MTMADDKTVIVVLYPFAALVLWATAACGADAPVPALTHVDSVAGRAGQAPSALPDMAPPPDLATSAAQADSGMASPDVRFGIVTLAIGETDGVAERVFGRIEAVALDTAGRIYVLDAYAHEVRVFAPDGAFQFRFGRQGSGPGDVRRPCCLGFGPEDVLWIRNEYRFLDAFEIGPNAALHRQRITLDVRGCCSSHPLIWNGRLLVTAAQPGTISGVLLAVDTSGVVADTLRPPEPVPDTTARAPWRVEAATGSGRTALMAIGAPFSGHGRVVYSPPGHAARVHTGRYHVIRVGPDGSRLPPIERAHPGPRLVDEERELIHAQVARLRGRGYTVSDVRIPERKPPIEDIWYDADGRLWVELSRPHGAERREAHVYAPDGSLAFEATWPAAVRLASGSAIRGNTALGIRQDEYGVQQVTVIRFAPR
jgi:hypothetical protein